MTAAGRLDLDAIRARCEAATPGEWKIEEHPEYGIRVGTKDEATWVAWTGDYEDKEFSRPDAVFIAHAPEDISALLAEVQQLREELTYARLQSGVERTLAEVQRLRAERDAEHAQVTILKARVKYLEEGIYASDEHVAKVVAKLRTERDALAAALKSALSMADAANQDEQYSITRHLRVIELRQRFLDGDGDDDGRDSGA